MVLPEDIQDRINEKNNIINGWLNATPAGGNLRENSFNGSQTIENNIPFAIETLRREIRDLQTELLTAKNGEIAQDEIILSILEPQQQDEIIISQPVQQQNNTLRNVLILGGIALLVI